MIHKSLMLNYSSVDEGATNVVIQMRYFIQYRYLSAYVWRMRRNIFLCIMSKIFDIL